MIYRVLCDDVGGVSLCGLFCFLGGAEHMKQLLYSILQQPVNQSLQQRQLRKNKKVLFGQNATFYSTITNAVNLLCARSLLLLTLIP